jgi:hypothetical protein
VRFKQHFISVLNESPDSIEYNSKRYSYESPEGNPYTFFITTVSFRPDIKKGYDSDVPAPFGTCIIYTPTHLTAEKLEKAYLEDPQNKFLTHWNLSSLLNYNEVYTFDELTKDLQINVVSLKTDTNQYFNSIRKAFPRFAFALEKNEEEIGLKYRGRFWRIGNKIVVSLWEFNEKIITNYVIPFLTKTFNVSPDDIEVETGSTENGPSSYVSGSNVSSVQKQKPHEKEINILLAKLHTASGLDKDKVRKQLKELLLKHNLDPKRYGIGDDVLKSSELTAQKMLGSKDTMAALKAKQQTSESFKSFVKRI